MSNIGRHRIWKQLAAITALALVIRPLYASIPVVQTESSEYLLGHRTAAIKSFGGTDALGWTDSSSYEGGAYTASRVAATVARETAIAAATLGSGTAARGGSAAAQAAYKGILATQAATGGYQIGTGASQIAGGDYEAGTVNVVAGGLRVGGSIASAGAIAVKDGTGDALQRIDNSGAKVRLNPKTPGQEGNVTLDFGSNGRVNIRVETHPLQPDGSPVRHANVETVTVINGKKIVTNIHILE